MESICLYSMYVKVTEKYARYFDSTPPARRDAQAAAICIRPDYYKLSQIVTL